jgi:hypothetical protein
MEETLAPPDDLLTAEEVAAMLKVKPSWVYERIRARKGEKLPHVKLGHSPAEGAVGFSCPTGKGLA